MKKFLIQSRRTAIIFTGLALLLLSAACQRKTPEQMLAEADEQLKARDILGAEMKYEDLLKRNPAQPTEINARMGLGMRHLADKEYDRAREQLQKAVKLGGGPAKDLGYQAFDLVLNTYIQEGKPEVALKEALATSDTLHPARPEIKRAYQFLVADLYMKSKQGGKAIDAYSRIIEQWPTQEEVQKGALERLATRYNDQKDSVSLVTKLVGVYRDYLARHPDTQWKSMVHYYIGTYEKQLNHKEESDKAFNASETELESLLDKTPGVEKKSQILIQLAGIRQIRGNLEGSSKTLQVLLTKYPTSEFVPLAKIHLADLAMMANNPKQALTICQEIVRSSPQSPYAQMAQKMIQGIQMSMRPQGGPTSGTLTRTRPTTGGLPLGKGPAAGPGTPPRTGQP